MATTFRLEIDGNEIAQCLEVTGLEVRSERLADSAGSSQYPTNKTASRYSNLVLRCLYSGNRQLWDWMETVVQGRPDYRSGIVVLLDKGGQQISQFEFSDARPCRWTGPDFHKNADTQPLEEIELGIGRLERL